MSERECKQGEVQVNFVGSHSKMRDGGYGWEPSSHAWIEVKIDGKSWRIDIGNFYDGRAERRGIHIVGPLDMEIEKTSLNACSVWSSPADAELRREVEKVYGPLGPYTDDVSKAVWGADRAAAGHEQARDVPTPAPEYVETGCGRFAERHIPLFCRADPRHNCGWPRCKCEDRMVEAYGPSDCPSCGMTHPIDRSCPDI